MLFVCPNCGGKLERSDNRYVCPAGHSYDIAAEGYVHLLPPNKMHAKIPGDTKQMVKSRRDFLETGFYSLFRDELSRIAAQALKGKENPAILDAGCGEGYYTNGIKTHLESIGLNAEYSGFDISKFAVKAAAKKYQGIQFAVASIFGIPVAEQSIDLVADVFAPLVPEEFCRVLKPGGTLVLAVPGERHLYGLKEILYDSPYENEHKDTDYEGFDFIRRTAVPGTLTTKDPKIMEDLFAMTPYYWKTPAEGSQRLRETACLTTEIQFDFLTYRKR